MTEQLTPGKPDLTEVVASFAMDHGGQYSETHTRYNLAQTDSLDVVITEPDMGRRERLLVTVEDEAAGELYDALKEGGVYQLPRHAYGQGIVMYNLPTQVKPMHRERLFIGHVSSETYISDVELFGQLGKLWHRVYQASGLVAETPLHATALQDFEGAEKALLPIPPYTGWTLEVDALAARDKLIAAVTAELREATPELPVGSLQNAIRVGWESDERS